MERSPFVSIKIEAREKGYKVFCRDNLIPYYEEGIKPDAIIFVHLYDQERQVYAKKLKQRNVKVFFCLQKEYLLRILQKVCIRIFQ